METTTNLRELRNGKPFTWGEFIKIHTIGEYDVVEFHPHEYVNCCATGRTTQETQYHCYINREDICISADSFDEALATCIAVKHDGRNTQAATFFMRMISVNLG